MSFSQRLNGVLLHPTSLPGNHGVGELGAEAYGFIDFLEKSGQKLWQVLPLGPTGYGDSPYASFSTFAGNPLLISLDQLKNEGVLSPADLADVPAFDPGRVDYGWVQYWKVPLLEKAARHFLQAGGSADFAAFCRAEVWLDDFALFMAVKEDYQKKADAQGLMGKMWSNFWDRDIRLKEPQAVAAWKEKLGTQVEIKKVLQFWFFRQWQALKAYANSKGVQIIGDIPIFVAGDSVDVWANRRFFLLDGEGAPTHVAGVPPDYFSATGQLWGNPLYNWEELRKDGFSWWIARIQAMLRMVDIIRIDHFRGFEAYWEIKAGSPTAEHGRWVKAPGSELFQTVLKTLGTLPILAEDLGLITPEVEALRDEFQFPGMKILQFAFDSNEAGATGDNPFLPHNYIKNCVVYTGSHDNDTIRGWFESASDKDKALCSNYVHHKDGEIAWSFIRAAVASTARYCVLPAQDLLNLPAAARMNIPSTLGNHNWSWRLRKDELNPAVAERLRALTKLYGR